MPNVNKNANPVQGTGFATSSHATATTPQNVNQKGLNQKDYIKYLTQQLNEKNAQVEALKSLQEKVYNYETGKPIQGQSSPGAVHAIKVNFFESNRTIGDCTALDYPDGLWLNIHELPAPVIEFVKNQSTCISPLKKISLKTVIVEYSKERILSIPHQVLRRLFEKNMLVKDNGTPSYIHTYISLTDKLNFIWDAFTFYKEPFDKNSYHSMNTFQLIQTFLGYVVIDGLQKEISDEYFHDLADDCDFMKFDIKEMVNELHEDYMNISKALIKADNGLLESCLESLGYLDNLYSFYQDCNTYLLTHNK